MNIIKIKLLLSSQILSMFGADSDIIAQGTGNFRLFSSVVDFIMIFVCVVMMMNELKCMGKGKYQA
ncbi:MAG: hypothetical protein SPI74_01645 [Eubacterium sp.]|nr:hypothetical protein [Eubacterium sp.]